MKFTAEQIAGILEGTLEGDSEVEVSGLSKIEEGTEGTLTFLANPKYIPYIYTTQASICIVKKDFVVEKEIVPTLIRVEDPYQCFTKLLEFYDEAKQPKSGLEQPHFISDSATYGENIYIGAFVYIGSNVKIGDNAKIYPNAYIGNDVRIGNNVTVFPGAKIYSECVVGDNCVIKSDAIIGSDGFGFAPTEDGSFRKVPQIGNVILEENVDIGAGTTIDRATMGSTIIRKGVKLDNQIHIAHNVEIGENTAIAAQTGIAGSSKIGKNCFIGGQVGIVGHIEIGDRVQIQAQSGISRNVKDDEKLQGSPALSYGDYNKSYVHFKNLPKIVERIDEIDNILNSNK